MGAEIKFDANFWVIGFMSLNLVLALITFSINRNKTSTDDLANLKHTLDQRIDTNVDRLHELACRTSSIETNIANMPTHDHLGQIYDKVNASAVALERLTAGTERILSILEKRVDNIDGFLRSKP